ncbi:unnamed protein product [Linum trigynum]|uniref:Uncharacterized protein n=1 Tax=Linum trigynum TaxID=586398 RepID=A0AAV2G916_9ROSI
MAIIHAKDVKDVTGMMLAPALTLVTPMSDRPSSSGVDSRVARSVKALPVTEIESRVRRRSSTIRTSVVRLLVSR